MVYHESTYARINPNAGNLQENTSASMQANSNQASGINQTPTTLANKTGALHNNNQWIPAVPPTFSNGHNVPQTSNIISSFNNVPKNLQEVPLDKLLNNDF